MIKEELEIAKIQRKISQQIDEKVNKQQKEFFLREQLKAIKKELGIEKDENESEAEKIERKLAELDLPEEALKVVQRELEKLKTLNAQSPEFNVTRNYLETIADLPWGKFSADNTDIKKARAILDAEHYGLDEVKDLILEFLKYHHQKRQGSRFDHLSGGPSRRRKNIDRSICSPCSRTGILPFFSRRYAG